MLKPSTLPSRAAIAHSSKRSLLCRRDADMLSQVLRSVCGTLQGNEEPHGSSNLKKASLCESGPLDPVDSLPEAGMVSVKTVFLEHKSGATAVQVPAMEAR